jgi:hemoglobin-like flavoprotein
MSQTSIDQVAAAIAQFAQMHDAGDGSTAMTHEQKRLVLETWKQVAANGDAAAALFYRRLFETDPTTRELFRATDMSAQRRKLLRTIGFAIVSLDHLDLLKLTMGDLGRRHAGFGVSNAHYDSMGRALLWTLEQRLGRAWTPAVASAWIETYRLLSEIMRNAASAPGTEKVEAADAGPAMKARSHFAHRIDMWDDAGENIIEHLVSVEDFEVAIAAYRAAIARWPRAVITLREGARVIEDSRQHSSTALGDTSPGCD